MIKRSSLINDVWKMKRKSGIFGNLAASWTTCIAEYTSASAAAQLLHLVRLFSVFEKCAAFLELWEMMSSTSPLSKAPTESTRGGSSAQI